MALQYAVERIATILITVRPATGAPQWKSRRNGAAGARAAQENMRRSVWRF